MLSKMNDSIEDLTVPVTPLTNVELEKVTGGVMRDEYGRGCTEGDLPIFKPRNVNALHEWWDGHIRPRPA